MGCCSSCSSATREARNKKRVLIIGIDYSGKTRMLVTLYSGEKVEDRDYVPTIGFGMETITIKKKKIDLWAVGGAVKNRVLWRHYIPGNDAVIFVIDGADRARFVEAKTELQKLVANEALQDVSWLIVSNKQDLPGCANTAEIEQSFELHTLFAERPYSIIETSLVTGIGVDKIKSWLEEECI